MRYGMLKGYGLRVVEGASSLVGLLAWIRYLTQAARETPEPNDPNDTHALIRDANSNVKDKL